MVNIGNSLMIHQDKIYCLTTYVWMIHGHVLDMLIKMIWYINLVGNGYQNILIRIKSLQLWYIHIRHLSSAEKYEFGVEIPKTPKAAIILDEVNGDTLWKESVEKELY
jgi:hypothetical protein